MRKIRRAPQAALILILLLSVTWPDRSLAQGGATTTFTSPQDGENLLGLIEIRGTLSADSFLSGELAFAYAADPTDTWFTIAEVHAPVIDNVISTWDTTAVSDGEYRLRLRMNTLDGTVHEAIVAVQVHNYTSATMQTSVPSPTSPPLLIIDTPVVLAATPTLPRPEVPTSTPLPANSAALTPADVLGGFSRGAIAVLAIFLLFGVLRARTRP